MADIPIVNDQTGQRGTVPGPNLQEALDKGFRVEEVAEQIVHEKRTAAELQPVRTVAEGLGRGATLGGTDALAAAVGDEATMERMQARRQANPLLSGGSEVLGGLATSLATGGLGTGAAGTALAARLGGGAAAKVAGSALASGLETAAFGAGTELSEAALENRDLRAEKLLAAAGLGFAMGGVGAGVLGAGGMALNKAAQAGGNKVAKLIASKAEGRAATEAAGEGVEALEAAGAKAAAEGTGAAAAQAVPVSPAQDVSDLLQTTRRAAGEGIGTADTIEEGLRGRIREGANNQRLAALGLIQSDINRVAKGTRDFGEKKIDSIVDTIKTFDLAKSSPRANFARTEEAVDKLIGHTNELWDQASTVSGKGLDVENTAGALKEMFAKLSPLEKVHAGQAETFATGLEQTLRDLQNKQGGVSFLDARNVGTQLDNAIKTAFTSQAPYAEALRDMRTIYRNNIMTQVEEAAGGKLRAEIARNNKHLSNMYVLQDAGRKAIARAQNRDFGLLETMAMLSSGDPLTGVAKALGVKAWKEYGAAFSARILDKVAEAPSLRAAAASVAGLGKTLRGELGKEGAEAITHAGRLALNARSLSAAMDAGVDAIFTGAPHLVRRQVGEAMPALADMVGFSLDKTHGEREKFDLTKKELMQLANNPEQMMERMQHAMEIQSQADPHSSPQFAAAAANAVKYLQSVVPKAPAADSILGAKPWQPSDAQLHEFQNAVNVVMQPLDVLERMRQGVLTNTDVNALQSVYPALYTQLRKQVAEAAARQGDRLTYARRLAIGRFLQGQQIERTTEPGYVAAMQQNYSGTSGAPPQEQQQAAAPQGQGTRRPASAKTPQSARFAVTETQRLESRSAAQ